MDLIFFILALSVLVLVHEWGHFIAARKTGVKVEEFGLGLPPRIIGKKFGDTIYSINWLMIGGFCRLYGEDGDGKGKDAFNNKNPWQK
ncbi:MAG: site-2 protease family protein, partial [Candidatus Shapirobacteria bacterium]|nr:site-2 protease family protein [Candidatus Shapirobacteria bacterium]